MVSRGSGNSQHSQIAVPHLIAGTIDPVASVDYLNAALLDSLPVPDSVSDYAIARGPQCSREILTGFLLLVADREDSSAGRRKPRHVVVDVLVGARRKLVGAVSCGSAGQQRLTCLDFYHQRRVAQS